MSDYPGRWWHRLDDGRIQCDLCPRDCRLHEGQRGACFVRKREGDAMVLTTYGRSSGFCIDPIEKKPLNHFYPGSSVLSFGTAGCNLACKFCQNWDISKSREMDTLMDSASPDAIAEAAVRSGCRSVAFTYNDPVIFAEYAMDAADACHARGIKAVAVTAGYIGVDARREFYAKMDAANVDLKGFTDEFYVKLCGARLQPVLDTLVYLEARDRRLVRDHDAADPGQERFRRGNRGDERVDRSRARHRRPAAFHRVPSRLQDDGPAAHAGRNAHARARHRAQGGDPLRLHGQRARPHRRDDVLSRLPQAADRARLARDPALRPDGGRPLPPLRRAAARALRAFEGQWGRRRKAVRLGAVA